MKKKQIPNKYRPEISVIVPMYNVKNLIGETIASLKRNQCKLEVLLIDDGSSDDTVDQAMLAIDGDKRFTIIRKANSGVSDTRNRGIRRAKGQYIFFCDSDDILADYALDKLYSAAVREKADYVYGGIKKFNSTKIWTIPTHDRTNLFTVGPKNILENPELFQSMSPGGKLIHRDLLQNLQFPQDIHCAEDQVVFFKIFNDAKKIYCIGDYIYFYRERDLDNNERSITQQRDIKAFAFFLDIFSVIEKNRVEIEKNTGLSSVQKNKIIKEYLERAFTFDVWPLFLRVIKFHKNKTSHSITTVINFIDDIESELGHEFINQFPALRYFFLRVLIDNIDHVQIKHYRQYTFLVNRIIGLLSDKTKDACSRYWGTRWNDILKVASSFTYFLKLRIQKRFLRWLNSNQDYIIKNYAFPCFKLLPVQKNKIVFATSTKGKCSANFTALLNELRRTGKNYEIKKFLGLATTFRLNFIRAYHLATAKNIILESYYRPLYNVKCRNDVNIIQIWHACGAFKRFGFSALGQRDANSEDFENMAHSFYTHIVSSSEETALLYQDAFNAPASKMHSIGVPRTDIFFNHKKIKAIRRSILNSYPILENSKTVLYSPTFRGGPNERKNFKLPFNYNLLDTLPNDYKLVIKLHPAVNTDNMRVPDRYKDRIIILSSSDDVNEWMIFCDILITDYSSLIFEYALMDKPIIFYAYDLDEYFDERGFYFDYATYTYGDIVKDQLELRRAILDAEDNKASYVSKKQRFLDKFMASCDGASSKRIIDLLIS
ncbi:hypothetical protein BMT54_11915 [Pasteurellaceae bacterium 15-036681]|nr:hypothetical protein BMT54_11915 [Pasteurellaceae bacterium 15-036681]